MGSGAGFFWTDAVTGGGGGTKLWSTSFFGAGLGAGFFAFAVTAGALLAGRACPPASVPGPTSITGAGAAALFDLPGALAAAAVCWLTLPKMFVMPSLTFLPAALPAVPPAAAAPNSVMVCADAKAPISKIAK